MRERNRHVWTPTRSRVVDQHRPATGIRLRDDADRTASSRQPSLAAALIDPRYDRVTEVRHSEALHGGAAENMKGDDSSAQMLSCACVSVLDHPNVAFPPSDSQGRSSRHPSYRLNRHTSTVEGPC